MNAVPSAATPSAPATQWRGLVWLVAIIALLILGSIQFGKLLDRTSPKPRLPIYGTVTQDLEAAERDGSTKKLSALRGKVFTCAYLYTVCPHGCAAVMGQMSALHKAHSSHPDFHQVSIAVVPEQDSPQLLSAYAQAMSVKPGDPWWFLTGNQQQLWSFMDHGLKMTPAKAIPPDERLNPLDLYEHDLRIALIDRQGQIRGYYAVFHPQAEIAQLMCEKLQRDVRNLLDHPEL